MADTLAHTGVWRIANALLLAAHALLIAPPILLAAPPYPEGESSYFHQTGYYVEGPFFEYYRTRGGERIFGYPQTQRFYDPQNSLWVQYFDNVRMEWHPKNPEPHRVQLGLLAQLLGYGSPPIRPSPPFLDHPLRRYFPETGHTVSYAFLQFYDQNGGLDIFGYPISEPLLESGRVVQYFQRARMEWRSEHPQGSQVTLGRLGAAYIERFGVPDGVRETQPGPGTMRAALRQDERPRVWAFVRNAITGRQGEQTVYVYVTDARGQPLSGAVAAIAVRFTPHEQVYTTGPTDRRGIASVTFPIESPTPGQKVVVEARVELGRQSATAQTFFVPWY